MYVPVNDKANGKANEEANDEAINAEPSNINLFNDNIQVYINFIKELFLICVYKNINSIKIEYIYIFN